MILTDPEKIRIFQMLTQASALGLEIKGLKSRGGSVYARIKKTYNLKGSKQSVHKQFKAIIAKEMDNVESN